MRYADCGLRSTCESRRNRAGFTLLELMVVIAIIAALAGLILYASSRVINAQKPTRCKTQLTILADAIRRYSDAWPAWKYGSVQIAAKGYPDWCAARLFGVSTNPVVIRGQFINPPDAGPNMCWSTDLTYQIVDPAVQYMPGSPGTGECDPAKPPEPQLHSAIECLAWCLTRQTNGGPFLKEDQFNNVRLAEDDDEVYPHLPPDAAKLLHRREIVDPWNHPVRFFWVYPSGASTSPGSTPFNPSGWQAITTADGTQAAFWLDANRTLPKVAKGIVIESAGPDGRFGNRWADVNPTSPGAAQDLGEAKDNLWELIQ